MLHCLLFLFFFNDTATTEIYTLSLHDALPISGSERSVSVLARYIATCRGRTTFAVRREDRRSERLTLYCRATTRWMSSILTRLGSCGRIRSRTSRSAISSVTGWPVSLL